MVDVEKAAQEFEDARREIRDVRGELAKRPTRRQFRIVIGSAILAVLVVIFAAGAVILSTNSDQADRADRLDAQVSDLTDQNSDLIEQNKDIKKALAAIDKATDQCAQARSARNTSRILYYADDIVRDATGAPRRPHLPLPPLPEGYKETGVVTPPG